jgi:hypothetical protein
MLILLYLEEVGSRFIRNDVIYVTLYTASYSRISLKDEKKLREEKCSRKLNST